MKYFILLFSVVLFSCHQEKASQVQPEVMFQNLQVSTVDQALFNELIGSTHPIDLSMSDLKDLQDNNFKGKGSPLELVTKFKAVVYRFYNQVDVKDDGSLVSQSSSGKELGIDQEIFEFYKEDLTRLSAEAKKAADFSPEKLREDILENLKSLE